MGAAIANWIKPYLWFICCFMITTGLLTACDQGDYLAPVVDITTASMPRSGQHEVVTGETLYSIAWRYGLDYRYVAKRNQIEPPYAIHPGQKIYLKGELPPQKLVLQPIKQVKTIGKPIHTDSVLSQKEVEPNEKISHWVWPVKGKIIQSFATNKKGINIGGSPGQTVVSIAGGKVVYCGNALRGYGNLIIIKHNSNYLSAYAYNQRVYVKEGEWVKKGQRIAAMGHASDGTVMLHFEIRRGGKPINPVTLYR